MKKRKVLSGEQKTIILRELLDNKVPISDLSEKSDIHATDIYNWKKKLFEAAPEILNGKRSGKKNLTNEQKKIAKLEEKLRSRDEAISFLLRENIELKKNIDGEI